MARKYKEGDVLSSGTNQYTILKVLNKGALAVAYSAKMNEQGGRVFLKQYKSPSTSVAWYKDWIQYQRTLNARIQNSDAEPFTISMIDDFECAHPKSSQPDNPKFQAYHQVFPFSMDGEDLKAKMEDDPTWEIRLRHGIEFINALIHLHRQQIVHTDLKPENVFVKNVGASDTHLGHIRLIDFDFSIMADMTAPWEGHTGYVGTPGYMSPEHLRKEKPIVASDIFTAGLILFELLTDENPYVESEPQEIFDFTVAMPQLLTDLSHPTYDALAVLIRDMLAPDPQNRTPLSKVYQALEDAHNADFSVSTETEEHHTSESASLISEVSPEISNIESDDVAEPDPIEREPVVRPEEPVVLEEPEVSVVVVEEPPVVEYTPESIPPIVPDRPASPRGGRSLPPSTPPRREEISETSSEPPVATSKSGCGCGLIGLLGILALLVGVGVLFFMQASDVEPVGEPISIQTVPKAVEGIESEHEDPLKATTTEERVGKTDAALKVPVHEDRFISPSDRMALVRRAKAVGWENADTQISSDLTSNEQLELDNSLKTMEELKREWKTLQFLMTELKRSNPLTYPFDKASIDAKVMALFKQYHEQRLRAVSTKYKNLTADNQFAGNGKLYPQYQKNVDAFLEQQAIQKFPSHALRMKQIEKQRAQFVTEQRIKHRKYMGYVAIIEVLSHAPISVNPKNSSHWGKQMRTWNQRLSSNCERVLDIEGPSDSVKQFKLCVASY